MIERAAMRVAKTRVGATIEITTTAELRNAHGTGHGRPAPPQDCDCVTLDWPSAFPRPLAYSLYEIGKGLPAKDSREHRPGR